VCNVGYTGPGDICVASTVNSAASGSDSDSGSGSDLFLLIVMVLLALLVAAVVMVGYRMSKRNEAQVTAEKSRAAIAFENPTYNPQPSRSAKSGGDDLYDSAEPTTSGGYLDVEGSGNFDDETYD